MFEIFPFLLNNFSGNNFNENLNNGNNNYRYNSFINGNERIDVFSGSFIGTFGNIFNDVFTSLVSNEELMNNIIDSILNSDAINSIMEFEDIEEIKLDFRDYGDRYLIEGKLEDLDKKDIEIDYENDHITIKVKRESMKDDGSAILMFEENKFVEKSFYVPRVDKNRIQAVYNANVLRIYLKKLPDTEKGSNIVDVESYTDY